jgi:hypothetical protein
MLLPPSLTTGEQACAEPQNPTTINTTQTRLRNNWLERSVASVIEKKDMFQSLIFILC